MKDIVAIIADVFVSNGLITAFLVVGIISLVSEFVARKVTHNRIRSSAVAIMLGLVLAYVGGMLSGGNKGIADISIFTGIGVLGGSALRDFTIVSTAFGAKISEIKDCGMVGIVALLMGIVSSFVTGALIAVAFGYYDSVSVATIAAGTVTFVVGPITGAAVGADSSVVAISIAAGLIKSIVVMILTPIVAKYIGLTTPRAAMIYGGLMGTTSGTAAGLAATDPELVPYGAMTATFYTGLGCLLCPSVLYAITKMVL